MLDIGSPASVSANLSAEEVSAIQLTYDIGSRLVAEHPEIADLYRSDSDFSRYIDIARKYLGERAKLYPHVCSRAVGYAVRQLISPEERREIQRSRQAERLAALFGGFGSNSFREHCRTAALRRHKLCGVDSDAMTRARGLVPWSAEEKNTATQQVAEGLLRADIVDQLNQQYHNEEPVRTLQTLRGMLKDEAARQAKLRKRKT